MRQSASQAAAFYRDVATSRKVWTIRDAGGFPAPMTGSGRRAQPFWSSVSRAQRVIKNVPAYHGFYTVEVSWEAFRDGCLGQLEADGFLVGVNWSGKNATGYDLEPAWVRRCVEIELDNVATAGIVSPSRSASKPEPVGPDWFRRIFRRL